MAGHRVVVCRGHAGPQEDVVLDDRPARDVHPGLDQHAGADDDVIVDRRSPPEDGAFPERRPFAQLALIAEDRAGSDARRRIQNRPGADRDAVLDDERIRIAGAGRARPGAQPRALAKHRMRLDQTAGADPRPAVDDGSVADNNVVREHRVRGDVGGALNLGHSRLP